MVLAQKYPVERVASAIVTLWGICLILTPACTTWKGLYAQRFFLGALESGISPMFMYVQRLPNGTFLNSSVSACYADAVAVCA